MPSTKDAQHIVKKKRNRQVSNNVRIGDKAISLERYLATSQTETSQPGKTLGRNNLDGIVDREERISDATATNSKNVPSPIRGRRARTEISSPKLSQDQKFLVDRQKLPIWQHRREIQAAVGNPNNKVVLLIGETGSGKSTQVPQFLYTESWCKPQKVCLPGSRGETNVGGIIAITQPRRVAATSLAHRVSQETGTPLGKGRNYGLVGYSVRFDHQLPRGTKIKFLTEGTLLQELLHDPHLKQYSAVVLDEIHERSLNVDLLAGFLKQILAGDLKGRGGIPLKVIVMSATADVGTISHFFEDLPRLQDQDIRSVEVLRIRGRQFPVDVRYVSRPVADLQEALVNCVLKIHAEEPLPGDILVFLTGQEEIESAQKLIEDYSSTLESNLPKIKVIPLYGQLSVEAQREAFLPMRMTFTRKVVLATNIAETSVTVSGVRFVVDCGKVKVKQYRPGLSMESLLVKGISKSSAIQRAGRAGREGPGKCFRLYTEDTFKKLQNSELPEILRSDVLGAVLTMKARGIQDIFSFPLMDAPETEAFENAVLHLHFLGALYNDGSVTSIGEKMARFPIPPQFGVVLLAAAQPAFDCLLEAIDIIACITAGDDIFMHVRSEEETEEVAVLRSELQRQEGDVMTYLTAMQLYAAEASERSQWCQTRKLNTRNMKQAFNIRKQLRSMCLKEKILFEAPRLDSQPFMPLHPERAEVVLKCFLRGFAMKTAMLAPDGSYVTISGKHVVAIHPSSVLHGQKKEAIMFLEHLYTNKSYAKKVSAIKATWIAEALDHT